MIPRSLVAILLVVARPIINGALWALGASATDSLIKTHGKAIRDFMSKHLLFHPRITLTAALVAFASFCTLIATLSKPLSIVLPLAPHLVAYAMVLGPIALWIATYGRSPASAVDNNTPPA